MPHRADPARAEPLPYGKAPQKRRAATGRPYNTDNIRSPHPVGAGVLTGPRTGDISPPGEVLSMDGKYPKILGPAGPNPERTFGKCPEYVRRGHELEAAAFSARCRSHLYKFTLPIFSPRASRMPCLSGSVGLVPRSMHGPMGHRAMTRINNAPSSVIAYGDATFPPGWGRLGGRVLKASPHRGEAGERSETDEGAEGRPPGG